MSGSNDLLGDLVAEAQQGARGETGALELLERETEMRNLSKKAKTIIAGAAIAGLASTGVAYAYWTTTGSGDGAAATTAGQTDTLVFTQTALDAMYPGDSPQTLTVEVKTTLASTQAVYVTNVKAYLEVTASDGACTFADFKMNGSTATGTALTAKALTWTAQELDAAGAESHDAVGSIQFNNLPTPQDGCKNAVVAIHYLGS